MNIKKIMAVFRKDFKEIKGGRLLWVIFLFPLMFSVILPTIVHTYPQALTPQTQQGLVTIIQIAPPEIRSELEGMNAPQIMRYVLATIVWAPLFLLIPLFIPTVVAADSFAGEKERKTAEGLLVAPITIKELLFGKIFLPFTLAIGISWIHFGLYALTINLVNYPLFGRIIFPNTTWILMMFLLVPTMAFFSISMMINFSMRAKGTREAQQLGGISIIPALAILFCQLFGVFFLLPTTLLYLTLIFIILDLLLLKIGTVVFSNEKLMGIT